jgi:hypothetical protein
MKLEKRHAYPTRHVRENVPRPTGRMTSTGCRFSETGEPVIDYKYWEGLAGSPGYVCGDWSRLWPLTERLGIPAEAFVLLYAGTSGDCLVIPERDADSQIVGYSRRAADGTKNMIPGSRRGLILPTMQPAGDTIFIPEGATDTATLLAHGLPTVGRSGATPSALCLHWLVEYLRKSPYRSIVLVADRDAGAGMDGAKTTAARIKAELPDRDVRIVQPIERFKSASGYTVCKDVRMQYVNGFWPCGLVPVGWEWTPPPPCPPPSEPEAAPGQTTSPFAGTLAISTPGASTAPPPWCTKWSRSVQDQIDDSIALADLMRLDMPEPVYIVPNLIPGGCSYLAGRPKSGKSWLALLSCLAVAGGYSLFGEQVKARPVLYLALEDTRRRIKSRVEALLKVTGWAIPPGLTIRTTCPRQSDGGLAVIEQWLASHPGGLVIVDTLAMFRDVLKRGDKYELDYIAVASLKKLADHHGGGVLALGHTRKQAGESPFDEISGTLGLNGGVDTMLVLQLVQGQREADLYLKGRDVVDATLRLQFGDGCCWTLNSRGEGIERREPESSPAGSKRCEAWLRAYLGEYAHPDSEILAAATAAHFGPGQLKRAKTALRKAESCPLASRPSGPGREWYCWIDRPGIGRPPDRPLPPPTEARTEQPGDRAKLFEDRDKMQAQRGAAGVK